MSKKYDLDLIPIKKKRYLKKDVANILLGIEFILFLFMGTDHPDLGIFIISKLIVLILMIAIYYILATKTKLFEVERK